MKFLGLFTMAWMLTAVTPGSRASATSRAALEGVAIRFHCLRELFPEPDLSESLLDELHHGEKPESPTLEVSRRGAQLEADEWATDDPEMTHFAFFDGRGRRRQLYVISESEIHVYPENELRERCRTAERDFLKPLRFAFAPDLTFDSNFSGVRLPPSPRTVPSGGKARPGVDIGRNEAPFFRVTGHGITARDACDLPANRRTNREVLAIVSQFIAWHVNDWVKKLEPQFLNPSIEAPPSARRERHNVTPQIQQAEARVEIMSSVYAADQACHALGEPVRAPLRDFAQRLLPTLSTAEQERVRLRTPTGTSH